MVYARPYGQPALYAQGGPIIALPSGKVLAAGLPSWPITASRDGKLLFSLRNDERPNTLSNYSISVDRNHLVITPLGYLLTEVSDLAVTSDSKRIYVSGGLFAPYDFFGFRSRYLNLVQSLAADAYPDNVEIDENNRIIGGISPGQGGPANDIYVYNSGGYLVGNVAATPDIENYGQQPGGMKVSGDATRVVVVTAPYLGQTLVFRSLP
jgi:hypothetical protein